MPTLEDFSLSTLAENISVAAQAPDGTLVGVCVNSCLTRADDEQGRLESQREASDVLEDVTALADADAKFDQIRRLLSRTSAQGDVFAHVPADVDRVFDIFILSVDDSWRGMGIAKKLLDRSRSVRPPST